MCLHEVIQSYFNKLYTPLNPKIKQATYGISNEIYGELYYYSIVKLLTYLNITAQDHFLDLGSGLGKVVFQVFLTTNAQSVTGIETNKLRFNIANLVKTKLLKNNIFKNKNKNLNLNFIYNNFLEYNFINNITIIYMCSTVFSVELLANIVTKINNMPSVKTIASTRKLPDLTNFKLIKTIFLHGTWDRTACYIYQKNI